MSLIVYVMSFFCIGCNGLEVFHTTDASTGRPWEYNPPGVSVNNVDVGVEQVLRPAQVGPGPDERPQRVMHAARCTWCSEAYTLARTSTPGSDAGLCVVRLFVNPLCESMKQLVFWVVLPWPQLYRVRITRSVSRRCVR